MSLRNLDPKRLSEEELQKTIARLKEQLENVETAAKTMPAYEAMKEQLTEKLKACEQRLKELNPPPTSKAASASRGGLNSMQRYYARREARRARKAALAEERSEEPPRPQLPPGVHARPDQVPVRGTILKPSASSQPAPSLGPKTFTPAESSPPSRREPSTMPPPLSQDEPTVPNASPAPRKPF